MGEAAGTAAALALRAGIAPARVAPQALQQQLERQGVFLGAREESRETALQ
jgi:hypothetical protein